MTMTDWVPFVTALLAIAAFVFSVYKYTDTQRLLERNNRVAQFNDVLDRVAGRTLEGQVLVDIQQAAAVYQLSEFPEYKELALPIINHYLMGITAGRPDDSLFRAALLYSKEKLSGS